MPGMNATTGRQLSERQHLAQSVQDILTTPLGSRVMRRNYGSLLPELLDQPLNGPTVLRVYSATVVALMTWEPRLRVQHITRQVSTTRPGRLTLCITAQQVATGETFDMEVPIQ